MTSVHQRRLTTGLLALAFTTAATGVVAQAAAPTGPADRRLTATTTTETGAASPSPVYDTWGLRTQLETRLGERFGGLFYDDAGVLVVQAVIGDTAAVEQEKATIDAGLAARAPEARIVEVEHSLVALDAAVEELKRLSVDWTDGAIVSFGVDDATNSVRVGLRANTPATQAAVLAASGVPPTMLTFVAEVPAVAAFGRFDDSTPFNAGNRIFSENELADGDGSIGGCTTGFGVHDSRNGTDYLLTAAHCSVIAGQADFFWNGSSGEPRRNPVGFSTGVSFGSNGWDTQLIRSESSTITWTAASTRSTISAGYTPSPKGPERLINEGATSAPWRSGQLDVVAADRCINVVYQVWGSVPICHLWGATSEPGKCATRGGDSGGPLVWYSGYGPLAAGQIVAGSGGFGGCYRTVWFHAIGDMLADRPHPGVGPLHINSRGDPG